MRTTLHLIVIVALTIPSISFGLSMERGRFADPVMEAIHQGDRKTVLKSLKQGYDPNAERIPRHTAVSYAAQCRRLQILKDLIEYGGEVNLHAVRSARARCPIDIRWAHSERRDPLANTFAYLFWEKGYFWRLVPVLLILLVAIMASIVAIRKRSKKKANKELKATR